MSVQALRSVSDESLKSNDDLLLVSIFCVFGLVLSLALVRLTDIDLSFLMLAS